MSLFLPQIPSFLLESLLVFLDFPDILRLSSASRSLAQLLELKTLWKSLVIRDFLGFLLNKPAETGLPLTKPQLSVTFLPLDSAIDYPADYRPCIAIQDRASISSELSEKPLEALKSLYKSLAQIRAKAPQFSGLWVGDYSAHGLETLRVHQSGFEVFAVKITGDINVPAGKMTWKVRFNRGFSLGRGVIHIADTGFVNPRWVPVEVEVVAGNKMIVSGYFPNLEKWFKVSLGCSKLITGAETPFMSLKLREME